ncbi:MAG: D-alanyl-D-alanine carboxypeptidase/D-alanyl-D-alanine-endopeptidase, partial [Nitrospinota bacterium]
MANALFWSTIFFQPAIAASTTDALVKEKVDALFRPGSIWEKKCAEKKSSVGIQVVSMGTRKSVYSHNHKKHFIPASNIKLITTVAALKTLSPQYRFRTEVFYDGSLDQGVLKGNLYVKGYGDPHMVSEELWLLVRELRSKGIGKISGDVIGDDTFFDDERYGNGWRPSTNSRAYSAELGALSLNFNSIKVYIDSFEAPEKKPVVLLDPPTDYIDVQNRILSDKRTKKANLTLKRVFSQNKNVVFAKGVVPRENKRRT